MVFRTAGEAEHQVDKALRQWVPAAGLRTQLVVNHWRRS